MLIVAGLVLAIAGVLLVIGERFSVNPGRLPGDIVWQGRNTTFYFPVVTSLLLSVVLSLLFWLFGRR